MTILLQTLLILGLGYFVVKDIVAEHRDFFVKIKRIRWRLDGL